MRDGRGGGHGELVGGVSVHDLLPQAATSHEGEHTRSGFSALGCQGPDMDLLNLFPGLPEGQLLLLPHPWMAEGGSGG